MRRIVLLAIALCWPVGCSEQRPVPKGAGEAPAPAPAAVQKAEAPARPAGEVEGAFAAQVAGQFYTGDPAELRAEVAGYLDAAARPKVALDRDIVGILAPHAGYRFSGPIAGAVYKAVQGRGYRTAVVLALSHRNGARKAALLDRPAYQTPLGPAPIDTGLVRSIVAARPDLFEANERIFFGEHSLEVQLPFIQVALPGVRVVPVIIAVESGQTASEIGKALYALLGDRGDLLFVMSSDLSHYYPYEEAVKYDNETLGLLEKWRIDEWAAIATERRGMCGARPILAFVRLFENYDAKKRRVDRIGYQNSGDTTGDRSRVVGYGALAFSVERGMRKTIESEKEFGPFTLEDRRELMALAKQAVQAAVKGESFSPPAPKSPRLAGLGAAFVTLKKRGELRGCIGHVIAQVPLFKCVADVARSAAVQDRRFSPVGPEELPDIRFEISVLTAPEPTTPDQVVVGRDGLIMSNGYRSGLLLPQVPTEWGWDKEQFLEATCRKAGLAAGCWKDPATEIKSFRAVVFGEEDAK